MPNLPTVVLIINAALLVVVIIISIYTIRIAQLYTLAFGDDSKQGPYRIKILKGLVAIVFIGLAAAVLNIFFV